MKPAPTRQHEHGRPIPKRYAPITAPSPLHPEQLARFVDPLPIPPTMKPTRTRPDPRDKRKQLPFYELSMRAAKVRTHRDVPETTMFSYGDTVPGPTFDVRAGQPLLVAWHNELPQEHPLPIDHNLCGA